MDNAETLEGIGIVDSAVASANVHGYVVATMDTRGVDDRFDQLFLRMAHTLHADIGLQRADVWARYLIDKLITWGYLNL